MSDSAPWSGYRYRVLTSTAVTPVIRELWLVPADRALAYRAGQYVLLSDAAHRLPQRSYSIANAPRADNRVSLLVTRYPGGRTSNWVHDVLKPGDAVELEGPYGTFLSSDERDCPILLLAAGSGLAPIRALAEALLADPGERQVHLFFSVRTAADAIDRARLEGWERRHRGFRFLLTLTRDPSAPLHRRIPELLPDAFGSLQGFDVFIAGPTGFVTDCAEAARAQGAADTEVHTEEFFADPQPWSETPPAFPESSTSQ